LGDVHYHSLSLSDPYHAYVHIADNNTETIEYDETPVTYVAIRNLNNGGGYAESFHPAMNGVIEQIDLMIYKTGTPLDSNGNEATLTIRLTHASINAPYLPDADNVWPIATRNYNQSLVPTGSGEWTTFHLSLGDDILPQPSVLINMDQYYAIKVTSNAVDNVSNQFRWQTSNEDCSYAYASKRVEDTLNNTYKWIFFGCGDNDSIPLDMNFRVHIHDFMHTGQLISKIFDTGAPFSPFTGMNYAKLGTDTSVVSTRTGPDSDPDQFWSDWAVQAGDGSWNGASPNNQYVQYKIDLTAEDKTGAWTAEDVYTPGVGYLEILYL
jgi:hypothetical protein